MLLCTLTVSVTENVSGDSLIGETCWKSMLGRGLEGGRGGGDGVEWWKGMGEGRVGVGEAGLPVG